MKHKQYLLLLGTATFLLGAVLLFINCFDPAKHLYVSGLICVGLGLTTNITAFFIDRTK